MRSPWALVLITVHLVSDAGNPRSTLCASEIPTTVQRESKNACSENVNDRIVLKWMCNAIMHSSKRHAQT
eukprot:3807596-Pleurochrysis_carterae.AAC.1